MCKATCLPARIAALWPASRNVLETHPGGTDNFIMLQFVRVCNTCAARQKSCHAAHERSHHSIPARRAHNIFENSTRSLRRVRPKCATLCEQPARDANSALHSYAVSTSTPCSVTSSVCSNCTLLLLSTVATVHASSHKNICGGDRCRCEHATCAAPRRAPTPCCSPQ